MDPTSWQASQLCQNCGLCCNGSLHNWTNLQQREISSLQALGLDIFELSEGSPAFHQPCSAFDDPVCTIYAQRPHACRAYECKLYQSLQSSTTDLPGAIEHARRARQLIAQLRACMPEADESLPLERQVRYQWQRTGPPPEAAAILDELVTLLRTQFGVRWKPIKPPR